jgi:hypothetical protein
MMETIILRGKSKSNAKLILELAGKLQFHAKSLSETEKEELGIAFSVDEGIKSGLLSEKEKKDFLKSL